MAEQFDVSEIQTLIEERIAEAQDILSDPTKIDELLAQLQQTIAEFPASASEALSNIPLMASMVKGYVTGEYTKVSTKVVASLVSAFLYLITNKDLINDKIPVLGIADDLAVIALVMKLNEEELMAFKQWSEGKQSEAPQTKAAAPQAEAVEPQAETPVEPEVVAEEPQAEAADPQVEA